MNFNIDESKIVKIVVDADKDNFIGFDLKNGEVTGTTIIPKKAEREYTKNASVLDREMINKSYDIAKKIKELRGDSGTANSVGTEIKDAIKDAHDKMIKAQEDEKQRLFDNVMKNANESKEIINTLESEEFKKEPIVFNPTGKTMTLMEELKEEAEKDFEETWTGSVDNAVKDEVSSYGGANDEKKEFQEDVTEKEQQILDIVSTTPIDKLNNSEEFLKKIGEYKNLMKSKMTKFEASKRLKGKLKDGGLIDTDGVYGKPGKVYPR